MISSPRLPSTKCRVIVLPLITAPVSPSYIKSYQWGVGSSGVGPNFLYTTPVRSRGVIPRICIKGKSYRTCERSNSFLHRPYRICARSLRICFFDQAGIIEPYKPVRVIKIRVISNLLLCEGSRRSTKKKRRRIRKIAITTRCTLNCGRMLRCPICRKIRGELPPVIYL